jgi:carbon-monoxide dehydrogenase medium subunit
MKPAPFEYRAPRTLDEAIGLLASHPDAKVLAGGQSLIPLLAFRLASPAMLVDLRRLRGLDAIDISAGGIRIGAKVRWRQIEDAARLAQAHPLLCAAVVHVAHYQIRNRGTVGGSLAHADPAAELPGIAVACEGEIHVAGPAGTRVIPAAEFFLGPLETVLQPDELIIELRLPAWPARRRWAFEEFSRRQGDFALAGVALFYDEDAQRRVVGMHLAVIGACQKPHRLATVEALLNGRVLDDAAITAASRAASAAVDPPEDLHAPADYRRALVGTLVERALRAAAHRGSA